MHTFPLKKAKKLNKKKKKRKEKKKQQGQLAKTLWGKKALEDSRTSFSNIFTIMHLVIYTGVVETQSLWMLVP